MFYLALIVGKISKGILRLFGRGGSLPGQIALAIDPQFLKKIEYPRDVIIITGTNGKSTVTNMTYQIMKKFGLHVICNTKGDNLKIGVASLLLDHVDFSKRVEGSVLVLEVDELSVPRVMEDLKPTYVVINNFFRDQLDRAGEMENIVRKIEDVLKMYSGTLILNGNDPSVARIGLKNKAASTYYFGIDRYDGSVNETDEASEGRFCPVCGKPIKYSFYQYSHLGLFHCENHFGNYRLNYEGKIKSVAGGEYYVNGHQYYSSYRAVYAFYNELATIALCDIYGIGYETIYNVIKNFKMDNGRMEHYVLQNKHNAIINLAKNPTGFNESMKCVINQKKECVVGLVLNDLEADGHDVSWIYDANFELLNHECVKEVVTCGTRYLDMALRVQNANYAGKITPIANLDDFVAYFNSLNEEVFVIANYTSLQPTRAALRRGSI